MLKHVGPGFKAHVPQLFLSWHFFFLPINTFFMSSFEIFFKFVFLITTPHMSFIWIIFFLNIDYFLIILGVFNFWWG